MKIVFVCHPWKGKHEFEEITKRICWHLAMKEDIVPFSPALLYNTFLNDDILEQRMKGITCGLNLLKNCDAIYIYKQKGTSDGMKAEENEAIKLGLEVKVFDKYPWEDQNGRP